MTATDVTLAPLRARDLDETHIQQRITFYTDGVSRSGDLLAFEEFRHKNLRTNEWHDFISVGVSYHGDDRITRSYLIDADQPVTVEAR